VTIRKSRISYEIDMATMMMAIMAETNGDWKNISWKEKKSWCPCLILAEN
jgi:hypothetical protein